jgi:uncharacterized membrane protein YjdF
VTGVFASASGVFESSWITVVVSGIRPHDRQTWWLETAPVLLAAPLLVAIGSRIPLTLLAYEPPSAWVRRPHWGP